MPMTWDDQNDVLDFWHYYQNINDLMTGIQLDNENWFAGEPQVQNDKSVEMFYLRKGELGENTKIVGVVSNRTYNYWTQGIGSPCDSSVYDPSPIETTYGEATNFEVSDLSQNIKFKEMGVFKGYKIEWYNALTGVSIDTTEKISDSFGHLKLEFPDTLTGNAPSLPRDCISWRRIATYRVSNMEGLVRSTERQRARNTATQTDPVHTGEGLGHAQFMQIRIRIMFTG